MLEYGPSQRKQITMTTRQNLPGQNSAEAALLRLLASIDRHSEELAALAAQAEGCRSMPTEMRSVFEKIGIYKVFAPRRRGGFELVFPEGLRLVEKLAGIDGSVGWLAMIAIGSSLILESLHPRTLAEIYAQGCDIATAGSAQPLGVARRDGDCWRVAGRWPFASGCNVADWLLGACLMYDEQDNQILRDDGRPLTRVVILPSNNWVIEDTWHVMGLRGTGSHHIRLDSRLVEDRYFFDIANPVSEAPGVLYGALPHLITLMHGAVHIGIAKASILDILKVLALTPTAELPDSIARELGRVDAKVKAAQIAFYDQARSHWAHAIDGTLNNNVRLVEGTQTVLHVVETCLEAVDRCFEIGGSGQIYEHAPLQRRFRDIHVAAQHGVVRRHNYAKGGRLLFDRGHRASPPMNALFN